MKETVKVLEIKEKKCKIVTEYGNNKKEIDKEREYIIERGQLKSDTLRKK